MEWNGGGRSPRSRVESRELGPVRVGSERGSWMCGRECIRCTGAMLDHPATMDGRGSLDVGLASCSRAGGGGSSGGSVLGMVYDEGMVGCSHNGEGSTFPPPLGPRFKLPPPRDLALTPPLPSSPTAGGNKVPGVDHAKIAKLDRDNEVAPPATVSMELGKVLQKARQDFKDSEGKPKPMSQKDLATAINQKATVIQECEFRVACRFSSLPSLFGGRGFRRLRHSGACRSIHWGCWRPSLLPPRASRIKIPSVWTFR